MKQEESLRRLGFGFVAFAMVIQMFAVMVPPEKSLATDGNAHILDGVQTRDDILRAWDDPGRDIAAIYSRFGLTRDDIAHLTYRPNVTLHSNHADYWTIGRTSLSSPSLAHRGIGQQYKDAEVAIDTGPTTVYLRQLRSWGIINSMNKYAAFEGWKDGKQFFILQDCGNFTQVDPTLTPPGLEMVKSIEGNPKNLKPGDEFTYQLHYRNNVQESLPAHNVVLDDLLERQHFDIVSFDFPLVPRANINNYLHAPNNSLLRLPLGSVGWSPNLKLAASIRVRIKNNIPDGTKICNVSKLASVSNSQARSNTADAWSRNTCIIVEVPEVCTYNSKLPPNHPDCKECPYKPDIWLKDPSCTPPPPEKCPLDSSIPKNDARCKPCPYNSAIIAGSSRCKPPEPCPLDPALLKSDSACKEPRIRCEVTKLDFNQETREATMVTTVTPQNRLVTITGYDYDFGDSHKQTKRSASYTDTAKHVYPNGSYTANVRVNYTVGVGSAKKESRNTDCDALVGPLALSKEANNLSQRLDSKAILAQSARMKAKDVIEYSLIVTNPSGYNQTNVNFTDQIHDLLDYADLDMAFLQQQGGAYDAQTKTISWKDQTVPASGKITRRFRITLKETLPATNQPSGTSNAYDCFMNNDFGIELQLAVDCPLPKQVEQTTSSLPKTGPGSSLIIGFTATAIIAYFFARSRLLSKELELIHIDFAHTGGI